MRRSGCKVFFAEKEYLLIDEYSMLSKTFLGAFSRNLSMVKQPSPMFCKGSFGGMSVILCRDFHQFPLVATDMTDYLFYAENASTQDVDVDDHAHLVGCKIYEEF